MDKLAKNHIAQSAYALMMALAPIATGDSLLQRNLSHYFCSSENLKKYDVDFVLKKVIIRSRYFSWDRTARDWVFDVYCV